MLKSFSGPLEENSCHKFSVIILPSIIADKLKIRRTFLFFSSLEFHCYILLDDFADFFFFVIKRQLRQQMFKSYSMFAFWTNNNAYFYGINDSSLLL